VLRIGGEATLQIGVGRKNVHRHGLPRAVRIPVFEGTQDSLVLSDGKARACGGAAAGGAASVRPNRVSRMEFCVVRAMVR